MHFFFAFIEKAAVFRPYGQKFEVPHFLRPFRKVKTKAMVV